MFIGEGRVPSISLSVRCIPHQKCTIAVVKRSLEEEILVNSKNDDDISILATIATYQWDAIFTKIKVFMKIFCRDIDKLIRLMNSKAIPGWFEGPLKLGAEKYKPQEELLMINDTHLKQLLWKGEWQKTLFNYRCKILGFKAGNNRNTQRTQGWDVMFSSINTTYQWHTWHSCN